MRRYEIVPNEIPDNEMREFIFYLERYTEKHRKQLLKKYRNSYKNRIRNLTREYIKEHNIEFKTCSCCGCEGYIEYHHQNYEKPLLISPLCKRCHGLQHRKKHIEVQFYDLKEVLNE